MGVINGSQLLLECLKKMDVDTIFGYPGGAVIPLFDALYDQQENFNIIRPAHEQGATHAADGYARTTGKTGVCIVTSGPGATNAVTGIATAYMDSIPMVVISGQVANSLLGKDSFQEINITGVTMPVTKHNILVRDIKNLENAVYQCFQIANSGRPGPVLIDIPKDVLMKEFDYKPQPLPKSAYENKKTIISEDDAQVLADLINESERPVIYAGGGVKIANASQEMVNLAQKAGIPVVNTLMGLGTIDRTDELSLGLVGMHGFKEANMAVTNSDLFIAIGARFSDRVTGNKDRFAPNAKIVHLDIDEAEIGKNMETHYSYICDIQDALKKIYEKVHGNSRSEWHSMIKQWVVEDPDGDEKFNARNIISVINKNFPQDAIVVTDVGQHQMWTAQYWKFDHSTYFVTSGGLGTMGYGIGAAIGSKIGNPNKPVILFVGDGGFRMTCNELLTISKYKVPVLIILINNHTLGMVRQWQKMFSNKRYMETDNTDDVDYVRLAEAYGIQGKRLTDIEQLKSAMSSFKKIDRPVLLECVIDKDDCVIPIVPPGEAIDDLIIDQY